MPEVSDHGRELPANDSLLVLPPRIKVPRPRADWLLRPRLLRQLDRVRDAGVGLVIAGAGYGKTTLVASWTESVKHAVDPVWLELRSEHGDPVLLAEHLGLALRKVLPRARGGLSAVLSSLSIAAVDRSRPILLVLDDIHAIADGPAVHAIGSLLERRPDGLLIVLSGRERPPGPWVRLRERRETVELGPSDLAFDRVETRQLLDVLLPARLPAAQVDQLYRRSEGWAAGLCLASFAFQEDASRSASSSMDTVAQRYTREYVETEVLGGVDPGVLRILERVSVVDPVEVDVARLLTGRDDVVDVLTDLARENRLVEKTRDKPAQYRFHPVLRDLLRERLSALDAVEFRALHALASEWYAERGYTDSAVSLALAADEPDRALQLIRGASGAAIRHGYAATVVRWLSGLSDETIASDAGLSILRGRVSGLTGDMAKAASCLAQARALVDGQQAPGPELRLSLDFLQAGVDVWFGAIVSARRRFEQVVARYQQTRGSDLMSMLAIDQEALDVNLAGMLICEGETEVVLELVEPYTRRDPTQEPTRLGVGAHGLKAVALALDGRSEEARQAIDVGRRVLERFVAPASDSFALHLATAWLGERPAASLALQEAKRMAERSGHPVVRAWANLAALRLAADERGVPFARTISDDAIDSVEALPEPAYLADLLTSLLSELGPRGEQSDVGVLSPAELRVLRVIASGVTRGEAAQELHLSTNTIKTHLRSAFRKLGVRNRDEAVARARLLGLVEPEDGKGPT